MCLLFQKRHRAGNRFADDRFTSWKGQIRKIRGCKESQRFDAFDSER